MKRLVFYSLLFAGLATLAFAAQQGNKSADTPPANTNFVGDDDGGLTEIVPADPATQGPRASGAVPVMKVGSAGKYFSWGRLGAISKQGPAKPDSLTSREIVANSPLLSSRTITWRSFLLLPEWRTSVTSLRAWSTT